MRKLYRISAIFEYYDYSKKTWAWLTADPKLANAISTIAALGFMDVEDTTLTEEEHPTLYTVDIASDKRDAYAEYRTRKETEQIITDIYKITSPSYISDTIDDEAISHSFDELYQSAKESDSSLSGSLLDEDGALKTGSSDNINSCTTA